ncbi:MAG TPA: hypothetical protein VMK12_31945 [Anaeromyxobacteraceae bacterium]|nr:hypothetical protein [Anaeromyxobacteraceae bacterium]
MDPDPRSTDAQPAPAAAESLPPAQPDDPVRNARRPDPLADLTTGEPVQGEEGPGTQSGEEGAEPSNPFLRLVDQENAADDARLQSIFEDSLKKNAEREAQVLAVAQRTGIPPDVVAHDFDGWKRTVESADYNPTQWREENPELAEWLLHNPQAGVIVHQDQPLNALTRALKVGWRLAQDPETILSPIPGIPLFADWRKALEEPPPKSGEAVRNPLTDAQGLLRVPQIAADAYRRGYAGAARGDLGMQLLDAEMAGRPTLGVQRQLVALDQYLRPQSYGQGPWEQLAVDAASGIGSMVKLLEQGGIAYAGAGLLGFAGTAAFTKNLALATAVGETAASIAGTAVTAMSSFRQQAGDAYLQYRDLKTDDGTPVPKDVAAGMAVAEGLVGTGIEMLELHMLAGVNKPISEMLKRSDGRAFLQHMLSDQTFLRLAADVGKRYVGAAGGEALEEGAQDLASDLFGYLGKAWTAGGWQKADPLGSLESAGETVLQSIPSALAMAGGGPALQVGQGAVDVARGRLSFHRVQAFNEAAKKSPTLKAAPEVVAEAIRRQTLETGEEVRSVFMDPAGVVRVFQQIGADVDTGADQLFGEGGRDLLRQALASGSRIEVPLADYLSRIAPKPIAEALARYTVTRPLLPTDVQTEELARQLVEQHKRDNPKGEAQAEKGEAPTSATESRLVDAVQKMLAATGMVNESEAKTSIANMRAFIQTQAKNFGVEPEALFKDFALRVERHNEEHAPGQGEAVDDSFDFGANLGDLPGAEVSPEDLPDVQPQPSQEAAAQAPDETQAPVEEEEPNPRRNVQLLEPEVRAEVEALIDRMKEPRRSAAKAFLSYSQGETEKDPRIPRSLEAQLARFGVVNPYGFLTEDDLRRRRKPKTEEQKRRKGKGPRQEMPDSLQHYWARGKYKQLFQAAFHGSPHDFDAFSLHHVGTGEGGQAYGWGLYFAGRKEVAEHYRRRLAPDPSLLINGREVEKPSAEEVFNGTAPEKTLGRRIADLAKAHLDLGHDFTDAQVFDEVLNQITDAIEVSERHLRGLKESGAEKAELASEERVVSGLQAQLEELRRLLANESLSIRRQQGQLYSVDIPDDSELLDYDKTVDQQSPSVTAALKAIAKEVFGDESLDDSSEYDRKRGAPPKYPTGREFYGTVGDYLARAESADPSEDLATSMKRVSEFFARHGIPGLSYLDRDSRQNQQDGSPSRNYVIWDDSRVSVTKKFYQEDDSSHAARGRGGVAKPVQLKLFQDGDVSFRGYMETAKVGAERVAKIVLTDKANRSTFLHEMGHLFLELFGDLSERPDAPAKLKEDWQKTLKYLGVSSRAELATEHHEKWAKSYEVWLREGKAPSPGLVRAFRRMQLWLRQVYKNLASLGVELSPEIRGVFDRLFATDAEIQRVAEKEKLRPMFRSPEEAGMNGREWQDYQDAQTKARAKATLAVDARVLRDKLEETTAWWKEEEKALHQEGLEAFDTRKDAVAAAYLKKGKLPDEWGGQTEHGGKLDRQAVVDAVGEERAKGFRLTSDPMAAEHPDDLAGLFDYPTGKALLEAVLTLPDRKAWAADYARQRMRERHPDILQEREELEQLVAKGLNGNETAAWLLAEWKALRQKAKHGGPAPIEAIKRAAKEIVDETPVRRLEVNRALQAMAKAADNAAEAAVKGAWAQSEAYKQQQILNLHIFRELSAAREARGDFEELASELSDNKARARLGKANPAYRDGVDTVLEALGLREPQERDKQPASLDGVITALENNFETVAFDPELLSQVLAKPRSYKDLTVAQLREVSNYLKNLRAAARNATRVQVEGQRLEKEAVIAQLAAEAAKNLPSMGPESSSRAAEGVIESGMRLAGGIDGSLLKPETMLDMLAGGDINSMWHRAITQRMQDSKGHEADLLRTTFKPVIDAFEGVPEKVLARLAQTVDGAALFPNHTEKLKAPTRRFELLMMMLNAGNESNLERLTQGRNITRAEVGRALDLLAKEELDLGQAILDAVESLGPLAFDLEERYSGVRPEKIQAVPIVTRHGTYRGGYFPAVYDARVSNVGKVQEGDTLKALSDPTYSRPGTSRGYLKSRAQNFADVIALEPGAVKSHFLKVAHDLAYREALRSVGGLVLSPEVQGILRERLGERRASQFLRWLKDISSTAASQVEHERDLGSVYSALKGGFVVGAIGYSLPVALADLTNYATNALVIPKRYWAQGMVEFHANVPRTRAFVLEKSAEMRFRVDNVRRAFDRQMKSLSRSALMRRTGLSFLKDHAFVLMEWTDAATATPLWLGAYRQAIAEGRDERTAVRYADSRVRKAFPSHSVVDKAAILRSPGFWGRLTVFLGYFNTVFNLQREALHKVYVAKGWARLPAAGVAGMQLLALGVTTQLLPELVSGRGPEAGDEDEDEPDNLTLKWANWAKRKLGLAVLYPFPGGSEVAGAIESAILHRDPSIRAAPGFAGFEGLLRAGARLAKDTSDPELQEKAFWQAARSASFILGVPTRPLRSAEYLWKAAHGDAPAEGPGDVFKGLVYGPPHGGQ